LYFTVSVLIIIILTKLYIENIKLSKLQNGRRGFTFLIVEMADMQMYAVVAFVCCVLLISVFQTMAVNGMSSSPVSWASVIIGVIFAIIFLVACIYLARKVPFSF
jgi:membrane protease YdiL (CAAX protease family)